MQSKFLLGILTSFFFVLVLTGCQSNNEILMDDVNDIIEISISKTIDFGKLNDVLCNI
ncbi:hypothetical protein [Pseudogracilibacillus sp. SO30301A]|uniref:hypothetical protein n=1 Tax=Pseudogracilibacillus sp. SO30301A TaxID=3098291 RepID=UPI00300E031C